MSVRRIYVEKKADFAVRANDLENQFRTFLGLKDVTVRELVRYDVENVSDDIFEQAVVTVFSEPPVDIVYREEFPKDPDDSSAEFPSRRSPHIRILWKHHCSLP